MRSLVEDLGMRPGDGLVVAYIPAAAEVMVSHDIREAADNLTLYTMGDTAIDVISERERPVKWWVFKNVARSMGFNHPEPIWHGAVEDFKLQSLPNVPQPEDTKLAIRQYARGPWITLTNEDFLSYA